MSAKNAFDQVWTSAVEEYLAATGRRRNEVEVDNILSPETLLSRLETDGRKLSAFREKHKALRRALEPVLRVITLVSKIASDVATNAGVGPACVLFGAIDFLFRAASGVTYAYDSLENLFEKLQAFCCRLEKYVQGPLDDHLKKTVAQILGCILALLAQAEKVVKDGRWKKFASTLFLGSDDRIKELLRKLDGLFDSEGRLVSTLSYGTTLEIVRRTSLLLENSDKSLDTVIRTSEAVSNMSKTMFESLADRQHERSRELLDAHLLNDAYRKSVGIYHEYREMTIENTGGWLLQDAAFQAWVNGESPIVWVSGGPGTGKSCLSSTAIHHLRSTLSSQERTPLVAYFYVKEHDQDLQDLSNISKSIAYQLARQSPTFAAYVQHKLAEPEVVLTPRQIWGDLLTGFFQQPESMPAWVVLDGLDEAPQSVLRGLFSALEESVLHSLHHPKLFIAMFARPEVAEFFSCKLRRTVATIEIGSNNEGDIALYIKQHAKDILVVSQTMRLKSRNAAVKLARDIRDRIMSKADCMFFKVMLVMNQISDKEDISSVYEAIESCPPQLEAMIARIFERLLANQDVDSRSLREILLWVSFAKRPLSIAELYAILKERTGRSYDTLEARLRGRFSTLFHITGEPPGVRDPIPETDSTGQGFDIDDETFDSGDDENQVGDASPAIRSANVATDVENAALNPETIDRFRTCHVRFSHASIREFLIQKHLPGHLLMTKTLGIYIDARKADFHIAMACMQYILNTTQYPGYRCNFLQYAGRFLADHLESIEADSLENVERQLLIQKFCGLFHEEDGLNSLLLALRTNSNSSLYRLFGSSAFTTMMQTKIPEWVKPGEVSAEEWDWIQATINNQWEFLRPLATQACTRWLTKRGHDDPDYVDDWFERFLMWIIYCFAVRVFFPDIGSALVFQIPGLTSGNIPAGLHEDIVNHFPPVQRSCHWYTTLGWLLYLQREYLEASRHFQTAIEMDKLAWKARHGLAMCFCRLGQHDAASIELRAALDVVPKCLDTADSQLRHDLIEINLCRGGNGRELAVSEARRAHSQWPEDPSILIACIRAHYAAQDFDAITTLISASKSRLEDLLGLLAVVRSEMARSLRATQSESLAHELFSDYLGSGRDALEFSQAPWIAAHILEFMFECYDDDRLDECLKLCRRVLDPGFRKAIQNHYEWSFDYTGYSAYKHATRIFYLKAVDAAQRGQDAAPWIDELRMLMEGKRDEIPDHFNRTEVVQLLAIYLRRHGNDNNLDWKELLGSHSSTFVTLQLVRSPEDGDTSADQLHVRNVQQLARLLVSAGDVLRATAIIELYASTYQPSSEEKGVFVGKERCFEIVACKGLCSVFGAIYNHTYRELHYCTECRDVLLCETCVKLVRDGKLPFRMCNSSHAFEQVYPVPADTKRTAGWLDKDGTIKLRGEWAASLLSEWEPFLAKGWEDDETM
ncbi:hypothetical protein QBC47DRAFT_439576 [Echria macrotheca]|uniref:Fungal STAND N-terminal Goodbye domain-containing protein n=1 Tax=Echria macrotheca TaxID=438768 RepID=A0AAJ0B291_9PEZI|nr:hypothetical protein QBC47DRAFT_439576 [Echria macrotheca]